MKRDPILAAAERIAGPLIKVGGRDHRVIHAYENANHFTRALEERYPDQTVVVVIQVSYVPMGSRKESDWVDVEVFDGPFRWGGSSGKDIGVDGKPETRLPKERELRAHAQRYGALAARASVRSTVLKAVDGGVEGRPARHLYGGE